MNRLAAFALVADEYERTGDAILGLAPMFESVLAERAGKPFEPQWFSQRFSALFGQEMSPVIAEALCDRLEAKGLLSRQEVGGGATIFICTPSASAPQPITEEEIKEIAGEFARSAGDSLASLARSIPENELSEAFLQRIANPEFTSIFLVPERKARSSRVLGLRNRSGRPTKDWTNEQAVDFLIADFILRLHEQESGKLELLAAVAYGALLADAIVALTEPPRDREQEGLRVVLDGPILLDALDINMSSNRTYASGLLTLFRESGLRLATFDHVLDEMQRLIEATLESHSRGESFGPLATRLKTSPSHAIYAKTIAASLEKEVKALGVTVLRSKLYEEPRFSKYFPESEVDALRNSLGDLHLHLERRLVDAASIAGVIRLKADNARPSSVLDAGTVFVTRNAALARRANAFLSRDQNEPRPRFTALTDGQLAGMLWFHSGSKGLALSRQRLIANCASAAVPRLDVVARISETLERLGEEHKSQFELLMKDERASLCPMRSTAGFADSVDEDRALRTLDEMRKEVAAPLVTAARAEAEQEIARIQNQLAALEQAAHNALLDLQKQVTHKSEDVTTLEREKAVVE